MHKTAMNSEDLRISTISYIGAGALETRAGKYLHNATLALAKAARSSTLRSTLANNLVNAAEHAYTFRNMDILPHISAALMSITTENEYSMIGEYYWALWLTSRGREHQAKAGAIFDRLAGCAPPTYKAKALLSLGTMHVSKGDLISALHFYRDAANIASQRDIRTAAHAQKMIAVTQSMGGDNKTALKVLDSIDPLVNLISTQYPVIRYDYLNTRAIVLMDLGRLKEAAQVSAVSASSSFSQYYREFRETYYEVSARDLEPSRSTVLCTLTGAGTNVPKQERPAITPVGSGGQLQRSNVLEAGHAFSSKPQRKDTPSPALGPQKPVRLYGILCGDGAITDQTLDALPDTTLEEYTMAQLRVRLGKTAFKKFQTKDKLCRMVRAVEEIDKE